MKFISLNRNYLALIFVALIVLGFFAAGLAKTLDYVIIKVLLFGGFLATTIVAIGYGISNSQIKNRLDQSQDDLD
ncbi:hypothetical protein J4050_04630 [Winogradskyella sp. DF17]|uniref:Uncharacterized protein n=1 Tax=Winogradskyella pelagia TaxID=2819984 RepID=A0ABS3T175_9FLAO|nr:hypothetical protein [Winogradskyella sp. DF17]MBO3116019.1 hypothetical protein [Winogradskyella sp. DF17]